MDNQEKGYKYSGNLKNFLAHKIYINVSYMEKGTYEINIIYKKKIIKKIVFENR